MLEHHYLEFWVVKPSHKLILGSLMNSTLYIQIKMVNCFGLGGTLGFLYKNLMKGKVNKETGCLVRHSLGV